MRFHHSPAIWQAYPTLAAGVVSVRGITADADVEDRLRPHLDTALRRLSERPVSGFPEIQAWRRAFGSMGLKPTQFPGRGGRHGLRPENPAEYRCASEALLRRLHKDGRIPRIHPLVDLCNHVSASSAIPIAVIDVERVAGDLEVRPADGTERYAAFSGDLEHPASGEVIFVDESGQVHARRWTNRQSATSAIRDTTRDVLIVVEALHDGADDDVRAVIATLTRELTRVWSPPRTAMLTAQNPCFRTETGSRACRGVDAVGERLTG